VHIGSIIAAVIEHDSSIRLYAIPIIFVLAANDDAQKVLNSSTAGVTNNSNLSLPDQFLEKSAGRSDGLAFSAEKVRPQKQRSTWRHEGLVSGAPGVFHAPRRGINVLNRTPDGTGEKSGCPSEPRRAIGNDTICRG
jgi:hypothetical protein